MYINPNLTPAEAAAAYELRVQRRLSAQRRQVTESAEMSTAVTDHPILSISSTRPSGFSNNVNNQNQLNASASNFVPLAAGRPGN